MNLLILLLEFGPVKTCFGSYFILPFIYKNSLENNISIQKREDNGKMMKIHADCGGWKTIMSPNRVQMREDG